MPDAAEAVRAMCRGMSSHLLLCRAAVPFWQGSSEASKRSGWHASALRQCTSMLTAAQIQASEHFLSAGLEELEREHEERVF